MTTEKLQVLISAKITDFEKKMSTVSKKLDSLQKTSATSSKAVDGVLASKKAGTNKAVDLVNKKLQQLNRSAVATQKTLSKKISMDSTGIEAQRARLDQLRQKYEELTSGGKTPTSLKVMESEFKAIQKQIAAVDAQVASLYTKMQGLQASKKMSLASGDTAGAAEYQVQIDTVQRQMDDLAASTDFAGAKADALNSKIQMIRMSPESSDEAQALALKIANADAKLQKMTSSAYGANSALKGLKSGGAAIDTVNKKLKKIEESSARTMRSVHRLGAMFLLMFARTLIRGAISGLSDSLQGASTKSDKLKSSLDTLTSAGRTISNSVVAALAPLINTAAPMIDTITNKIMNFSNQVAMFFAAISGQSTVLQATQAYAEYGAAADGAAASAAAANKALAGFDQITRLDTGKTSGGSGSSSGGAQGTTSYEEVPVVQSELAQRVGAAIDKLKGPVQDFYEDVLVPLKDWAMGDGLDLLVSGLENVSSFFAEHPELIDNLAVLLLSLSGLAALGPVPLAVGVTLQLSVAAVEWATGKDPIAAAKQAFDPEEWKKAGFNSVLEGWIAALSDMLLHGPLPECFENGQFADKYYDGLKRALGVDQGGIVGFLELGKNIGVEIGNGIIDGLNYLWERIIAKVNMVITAVGGKPIVFEDVEIPHIEYTNPYDQSVWDQTHRTTDATQDAADQTSKWASMEEKGAAQIKAARKSTADTVETTTGSVKLDTKSAANVLTTTTANSTSAAAASYSGFQTQSDSYLSSYSGSVSRYSNAAKNSLVDESAAGEQGSTARLKAMSNNATIVLSAMAENARQILIGMASNIALLPQDSSHISAVRAKNALLHPSLPTLQMFAEGGIVDRATPAIIGEAGREAVIPLDRNTRGLKEIAKELASQMGGTNGTLYLTVQTVLDGKVISEQVTKRQLRGARQRNKPAWGNT